MKLCTNIVAKYVPKSAIMDQLFKNMLRYSITLLFHPNVITRKRSKNNQCCCPNNKSCLGYKRTKQKLLSLYIKKVCLQSFNTGGWAPGKIFGR